MESLQPIDIFHLMYDNDPFSKWMDMKLSHIEKGSCTLEMTVKEPMLNGFSIAHGGISYSLADSALAFAANSRGPQCVSIETSISHLAPTAKGDQLKAVAKEKHRGKKTAIYEVTITNQHNKTVALFKGTVYITSKNWNNIK
ncbi:hydroxyphenylacetyl-CoA thioesterase PaaI [Salibacter halophilus]|uniref:Hydroxyphenylacetyl-CoA thioesterase PaaI n=1 Tax=Salibacter halophilus TaxID=1803916 RepID=A0A6N6MB92_9FLAO|nr:hydroxyphenylacetyl-CoA thioesterase PaaI [Salibacter halophilus]KAB1066259.1 hydroxyphenylacetyl-CoA thioesterase PaaI [Salibacter halophilus]